MGTTRARFAPPPAALGTLLVGLAATAVLFLAVRALEQHRLRENFERRADSRIVAVKQGLDQAVDGLAMINRLFTSSESVDRVQFGKFTAPLLYHKPPIVSLSYHRIVTDAGRAQFEAGRQAQFPGFEIRELVDGKPVRAARRPQYRVIDLVEPFWRHSVTFGLDANTDPIEQAAQQRACASGQAVMTGIYPLMVRNVPQPGVAVLMPVYRAGAVLGSGAQNCAQVTGYSAVSLNSKALVQEVLDTRRLLSPKEFNLSVYADRARNEHALAFRSGPAPAPFQARPGPVLEFFNGRSGAVTATFEVAGRAWHVEVWPNGPTPFLGQLGSLLMLIGGTLGSLLAAAYVGVLAARSASVRRMVDERTAALKHTGEALLLRQKAIDACLNSIIIIGAGPEFAIDYVNPAFEKLSGYGAGEVIGRSSAFLWGNDVVQDGGVGIVDLMRAEREGEALVRTCRKDGEVLWLLVCIAPVLNGAGVSTHFVVAHYDVTEKKRHAEELEYQASHDSLTGLVNRKLLRERLQQAIALAARARRKVWVVFIDLDRFKFVNDSLGHRAGDEFLKEIAQRLAATVRGGDTVARLGGDEFMLVLGEDSAGQLNHVMLERIMGTVGQPVAIDGQQFFIGCSAGIASYPDDGNDPDSLIEFADLAMYRAKEQGRNNFQFYLSEMNQRAQERLQLERALRTALEQSEFELHYQPQVELCGGKVTGLEVLVRWRHPERGLLACDHFRTVAEETGLVLGIDAWSMQAACAQAAAWQQAGLGELRIALKLGARQFSDPTLGARIGQVLRSTGLAPHCLELELPESLVMLDQAHTLAALNALRQLGVKLAIDDFGTGYSSMACLQRFPIDALKIDQSLVREIAPQASEAAISDAIISLAHSLGMRVIAEGVENEAQCEFLSRNMCDEIQGAVFSHALEPAAVEALLRQGRRLPAGLLRMHKRQRTLLLVDDEPNILSALKRQLRSSGHRILTAPGGQQGLDLMATEEVDVIVSDQRMPGMTGVEFLRMVKTLYPQTVRMVLSGFTELQSVTDAVNEGAIYKFLTKPWDDTLLRAHIDEAFAHKEMADENRRLDLEVRTANFGLARANRQLGDALEEQQEQISRDGISLEIVRELMQHVPEPIIGVDDDGLVAFANIAAQALFQRDGALLGNPAELFMPDLLAAIGQAVDGQPCVGQLHGAEVEVVAQNLGKGTRSRGKLIIFLGPHAHAAAIAADNGHILDRKQI